MKVVLQPQNGYINRIQALASAVLLAREIGAELDVQWVPSSAAPAELREIFSESFLEKFFVEPQVWKLDPYLNLTDRGKVVTLAGLERGEQVFMEELQELMSANPQISEFRISAGGKFALGGLSEHFTILRGQFYRKELQFISDIEYRARSLHDGHGPYLGVHLRYSDRSHQAPRRSSVLRAVLDLASRLEVSEVFLASDEPSERDRWRSTMTSKGLRPWIAVSDLPFSVRSALPALVDWRLLSLSEGIVFFSESSFGEEAAVAAGKNVESISLRGSPMSKVIAIVQEYIRAIVTYPKRHFFHKI